MKWPLDAFKKSKDKAFIEPGDLIEIEHSKSSNHWTTYAKLDHVEKKQELLLRLSSRDQNKNIQVGDEFILTSVHLSELIKFSAKLVERKGDLFAFSPSPTTTAMTLPIVPKEATYKVSIPIQYHAASSQHTQTGTLTEFSWSSITLLANLIIPISTTLTVELFLPYEQEPLVTNGKVISYGGVQEESRKHLIGVELEETASKNKENIIQYLVLSNQNWREN